MNILNKQLQTDDKVWSYCLGLGMNLRTHHKKISLLLTQSDQYEYCAVGVLLSALKFWRIFHNNQQNN
jgi:hypothetical protein